MSQPGYDITAKRKTVSLTINSDLITKAKDFGLNASRLAEDALARAVELATREQVLKDVAAEMALYSAIVEREGSFADMARAHYAENDANEAV